MKKLQDILIEQKIEEFSKNNLEKLRIWLAELVPTMAPFRNVNKNLLNEIIDKLFKASTTQEVLKVIHDYNPSYDRAKANDVAKKLIDLRQKIKSEKIRTTNLKAYFVIFLQIILLIIGIIFAYNTGNWTLPALAGGLAKILWNKFIGA